MCQEPGGGPARNPPLPRPPLRTPQSHMKHGRALESLFRPTSPPSHRRPAPPVASSIESTPRLDRSIERSGAHRTSQRHHSGRHRRSPPRTWHQLRGSANHQVAAGRCTAGCAWDHARRRRHSLRLPSFPRLRSQTYRACRLDLRGDGCRACTREHACRFSKVRPSAEGHACRRSRSRNA